MSENTTFKHLTLNTEISVLKGHGGSDSEVSLYLHIRVIPYNPSRISTKVKIVPRKDWDSAKSVFSNSLKRSDRYAAIDRALSEWIRRAKECFDFLVGKEEAPKPERICTMLREGWQLEKGTDFFELCQKYLQRYDRHSTETAAMVQVRRFSSYLLAQKIAKAGANSLAVFSIYDITYDVIEGFRKWCLLEGNNGKAYAQSTVSKGMKDIKRFYTTLAKQMGLKRNNPFDNVKIPTGTASQKERAMEGIADPIGAMLEVRAQFVGVNDKVVDAVNLWLFMYLCRGARPIDVLLMKKQQDAGDRLWFYENKKQKKGLVNVPMTELLRSIIDYYKDKSLVFLLPFIDNGELDSALLNKSLLAADMALSKAEQRLLNRVISTTESRMRNLLKRHVAPILDISDKELLKSARQKMAQTASDFGDGVASAMLNHSSLAMTKNYDDPTQRIVEANYAKVIGMDRVTSANEGQEKAVENSNGRLFGDRERLVELAQKKYEGCYDLSLVDYVNDSTMVLAICARHGAFELLPRELCMGKGCPTCATDVRRDSRALTTAQWVEKARNVHGDKFDYSEVAYKNATTAFYIVCNNCKGKLKVYPQDHLRWKGCKLCKQ